MIVISEETDGDLLDDLEQEQYSNVLCDTCGTSTTLETYKLGGGAFLEDQQSTVEPVLVPATTSNMPAILASHVSLLMSSQMLNITCCMYKSSSCTVVRSTAKMMVVQILGESQTRWIMQSSLSWVWKGLWVWFGQSYVFDLKKNKKHT